MGALIKILPWIAICVHRHRGRMRDIHLEQGSGKEVDSFLGGIFWPMAIVYFLGSALCSKVILPYFKWLKSGRPYFSGEIGKCCVQCKDFKYIEGHSAVEAKCRYDDRYIKARNCTCDKFRRNRFWRYKMKG